MASDSGDTVVALDVGGTTVKGAVVARDGGAVLARRRDTHREKGPDAVVEAIAGFADDLSREARASTGRDSVAVGLAVPGLVDERSGAALFSANLGWKDVPLRRIVSERLGRPVALCHDVRAGALVEGLFGAGKEVPDFLFLTLGTGVGAAMMVGGEPYAGPHGRGGELGHVPVEPDGPVCGCGNRGCVEAISSASAVARRYAEMAGDGESLDAEEIAARTGDDPVAAAVWEHAVDALARGIAGYVTLLDPDLVVLGGGMASAGERLFAPLRFRLAAQVRLREAPTLAPAMFGERAGRVGAAVNAWLAAGVGREELGWDAETVAGHVDT